MMQPNDRIRRPTPGPEDGPRQGRPASGASARGVVAALALAALAFAACNATAPLPGDKTPAVSASPAPMPAHDGGGKGAAASAPVAPAPNDCISSKCHPTVLSKKNVHDAAEGCTDCHEELSAPHPKKGEKTFGLLNDPPDLCYTCHDEYGKKKTVHSPVADGACTDCHDPHSSDRSALLKAEVGAVCKDCHEGPADHPNLHSPVEDGDCTSCHEPHESDTASLLLKEGSALCLECHDGMADVMDKKTVHSPLEDGCLDCHDPHGSAHPGLLTDPAPKLCFGCHETMEAEVADAPVSHGAMDDPKGCLLCHSPHSSDEPALLVEKTRTVCLECHDGDVPAKASVLHGKNRDGNCADCHTPHGGDLEGLLVKAYPERNYQRWSDSAYPLCFGCHERDMVGKAETSSATGFRDGSRNLHAVHVDDGEKGRSCSMCHDVHGTDTPKLVRDSLAFGKWKMQLKFVKTETGGGCAPGCHRPLYYDRDSAGRKPSSVRAGGGA
jgi:predicted CXXCH cytochrome family protein